MVSTKGSEIGCLFKVCLMTKRLQLAKKKPCCLYYRNLCFIGILQIKLREVPLSVVKCNYEVIFNYV